MILSNAIPLYKNEIWEIEPRDRIVKSYGFLSFAKNMGKNLNNKYGQKLLDSAKKKKLHEKEQVKKQQKQQVIWLVIKLLIK